MNKTKYKKAWKYCPECKGTYEGKEYSLRCTKCKKKQSDETGISVRTIISYEKLIWDKSREEFAYTIIGLWNEEKKVWQVEFIYECWPLSLKNLIKGLL